MGPQITWYFTGDVQSISHRGPPNSSIWFTISMDSSSSGWGPTADPREDVNETGCYINSWQLPC